MGAGEGPRADVSVICAAALAAVRPEDLVGRRLSVGPGGLLLDGRPLAPPLAVADRRIAVVGGGKGAAGMAAGLLHVLLRDGVAGDRLTGLVSVPEGCGMAAGPVEVRPTRPATENLPTPAVVAATREMLALVSALHCDDLAIALVGGGGSALLAAPRAGIPLEEKIAATRFLSAAGAGIAELNLVRRAASDVKAGGLARACTTSRMLVLVLSDVIGDPLDVIASGPCAAATADAAGALAVLHRFNAVAAGVAPRLATLLEAEARRRPCAAPAVPPDSWRWTTPGGCLVDHVLLASNSTAVAAAADAAERLGYAVERRPGKAGAAETADDAGRRLVREGLALTAATTADGRPRAIVEGGEAVVALPAEHGSGGRNQQTVTAALADVLGAGRPWPPGLVIASIGTDGEDGPTPAAGGLADAGVAARITAANLDAAAAAARCDSLPLLQAAGGLVVTGATGTNVADLRIVLARP